MPTRSTTSVLGYALLGLIQQRPSSGYDLRKTFAETAMGSYSSSPGAIYPALQKLEKRGLIKSEVEESSGLRRRRVYKLTSRGDEELKQWLSRDISRDDIVREIGELMLRFAFTEGTLGTEAATRLLKNLEAGLNSYVPTLKDFLRQNGPRMTMSGMLALDSGVRNYEALQQWTAYAIRAYQDVPKRKIAKPTKHR